MNTGQTKFKLLLISDFNLDNLASYILNDTELPQADVRSAPFGQVIQILTQHDDEHWKYNPDFLVVWTQPQNIIQSFSDVLKYEQRPATEILQEIDSYTSLLIEAAKKVRAIFVPTWTLPVYNRGLGMIDMKTGIGIANTLARMNLRLAENLENTPNIFVLDAQRWVTYAGSEDFNQKLWYMGKIAFGNQVFIEATKDIKAAINGLNGRAKKIIILDLDDTLWGGIVGEIGWEHIKLGGHDAVGEAYLDFQRALKHLINRGILLGIVSKNEENIAIEAMQKNPEMILKPADFAGWKINWNDKSQNISDLILELNLGFDSAVFIDDSPVERDRIRKTLPDVLVPELPGDPMYYKTMLLSLRCFDAPFISDEDAKRTKYYIVEQERKRFQKSFSSLGEWLGSLEMKVRVELLSNHNLQRTVQLLNKTNQMNLTTRRMDEAELMNWAKQKGHILWVFEVSDKFIDSGLTGIISLETEGDNGKIVDFVLSCRVMGRNVEETMLAVLIQHAQSLKLKEIYAHYLPTKKNMPCLRFFQNSGFEQKEENTFVGKLEKSYVVPKVIKLENEVHFL